MHYRKGEKILLKKYDDRFCGVFEFGGAVSIPMRFVAFTVGLVR